jgi:UDPglucose 6-dehydrogenase
MVATGIGMDKRIGRNFLNAGLGYGGSCFPKDVKAFIAISKQLGTPFHLLEEVERINADQLARFIDKVREALWVLKDKKIAVWGMTFKPDTDDVRNSVAIELINKLAAEDAEVTCCDPKGADKAVEWGLIDPEKVKIAKTPIEAVQDAEALILATDSASPTTPSAGLEQSPHSSLACPARAAAGLIEPGGRGYPGSLTPAATQAKNSSH